MDIVYDKNIINIDDIKPLEHLVVAYTEDGKSQPLVLMLNPDERIYQWKFSDGRLINFMKSDFFNIKEAIITLHNNFPSFQIKAFK